MTIAPNKKPAGRETRRGYPLLVRMHPEVRRDLARLGQRDHAHAARTALSCMTEISRPHCEPAHIAPLRPKLFIRDTLHEFAQFDQTTGFASCGHFMTSLPVVSSSRSRLPVLVCSRSFSSSAIRKSTTPPERNMIARRRCVL